MQLVVAEGAAALHLHANESPVLEINRMLYRVEGPQIAPAEIDDLLTVLASADDIIELKLSGLSCFYFIFGEAAVFHIMAFREDGTVRLELRRFT